jgi:hypothetical protein
MIDERITVRTGTRSFIKVVALNALITAIGPTFHAVRAARHLAVGTDAEPLKGLVLCTVFGL